MEATVDLGNALVKDVLIEAGLTTAIDHKLVGFKFNAFHPGRVTWLANKAVTGIFVTGPLYGQPFNLKKVEVYRFIMYPSRVMRRMDAVKRVDGMGLKGAEREARILDMTGKMEADPKIRTTRNKRGTCSKCGYTAVVRIQKKTNCPRCERNSIKQPLDLQGMRLMLAPREVELQTDDTVFRSYDAPEISALSACAEKTVAEATIRLPQIWGVFSKKNAPEDGKPWDEAGEKLDAAFGKVNNTIRAYNVAKHHARLVKDFVIENDGQWHVGWVPAKALDIHSDQGYSQSFCQRYNPEAKKKGRKRNSIPHILV